jgi:prevent-host-death family protein
MRTVTIAEAKIQFAKLLADVERGEKIVVTRGDVPVACFVPYVSPPESPRYGGFGSNAGQFTVPDDFDAPLSRCDGSVS